MTVRLLLAAGHLAWASVAWSEEAVVSYRIEKADPEIERIYATLTDGTHVEFETFRQSVVVTLTHLNDAPLSDEEWAEVYARVHVCDEGELTDLAAQILENGVRWTFDCVWPAGE